MGFSVSGATALILVAVFISLGIFTSAATNGFERVSDAYHADADQQLDRQNTAIEILSLSCSPDLNLTVKNTGTTALRVNDTDVLVDNTYLSNFSLREVDGDPSTALWLPGEDLHVEATIPDGSNRTKIVTDPGVSRARDC